MNQLILNPHEFQTQKLRTYSCVGTIFSKIYCVNGFGFLCKCSSYTGGRNSWKHRWKLEAPVYSGHLMIMKIVFIWNECMKYILEKSLEKESE